MNKLIVLSGPSGVGKGTIVNRLINRGDYALSVSCTTRYPREGEKDGVSYFFISKQQFEGLIKDGGLLEYSNHFGNYYGTPAAFVKEQLKTHNVILEIEVNGALQVKRNYPDTLLIMVVPPSLEELKLRLIHRGTENPEKIAERLSRIDYELSKKGEYDYIVVNDDLETAVNDIDEIIKTSKK